MCMSIRAGLHVVGVESGSLLPSPGARGAPISLGFFLRPGNFTLPSGQAVCSGAFHRAAEPGDEIAQAGAIQLFLTEMPKFCALTPESSWSC